MKQEKNIERKAESQNGQSIQDALTEMNTKASPLSPLPRKGEESVGWRQIVIKEKANSWLPISPSASWRRQGGGFRGLRVGYGREGPPGRARSPGTGISPFREHPPDRSRKSDHPPDGGTGLKGINKFLNYNTMNINILLNNKKQILNNNFFNHLIFIIMKKQILILAFVVMAIFASVNNSFGQTPGNAVLGSAPRGTSCVDDALHPLAGKEYTYSAASNEAGNFTFWATKDANFISSTGTFPTQVTTTNMAGRLTTPAGLLTATNYATASATDNVQITWSDATLAGTTALAPTFVVATKDGVCTNNIKVWPISPIVAFTVDIRNIENSAVTSLAYDAAETQCLDQVRTATYNAPNIEYNFGTQYLYWEVVAANFTNSWTPTFQISGLGNGQTATIEWDVLKTFAAATTTTPVAIANGTPVVSATAVTTAATNTSTGVSIYVRVTIQNNTYEGTLVGGTPITLAVDGQNSVSTWDIVNGTGATCTAAAAADQADTALQTLLARPTTTSTTVGVVLPNPALFIPTNATN